MAAEKIITDADVTFAENVVKAMGNEEKMSGGPRFNDDIVNVVRNLVTATDSLKSTVQNIVNVLDGHSLGDRTDGMVFRLAKMEREQTRAHAKTRVQLRLLLGIVSFVAARIGYIEWTTFMPLLQKTLGIH